MFENILYATDFSESPLMLPCIGIIGKTKKIHLLHVVGDETEIDPKLLEPQMHEARSFLEDALNTERHKGVEVDVHVMPGAPAREICAVADRVDASLIVVNYHKPEGLAGSATMELVKNCPRNLLVMTRMASDAVERTGKAMDSYCTNLFRRILCIVVCDPAPKLGALRSLKEEVKLQSVAFVNFSEKLDPAKLMDGVEGMGLRGEVIPIEDKRIKEVIARAETADASIILVDARTEMGLALSLAGASDFPVLVLKSI